MTTNNDDPTTLNPGQGGDSMDQTGVRQPDGAANRKRPRIVPAHDSGELHGPEFPGWSTDEHTHQLLTEIRDLLVQLVRLNGGVA